MTRRKALLRWLIAFLAIDLAAGLWIAALYYQAHQILQEHQRESQIFLASFPAELTRRPAILDPAEPGNGWDLHQDALFELVGPRHEDPPSLRRFGLFGMTTTVIEGDPVSTDVPDPPEPHLEPLRAALRRSQVLPVKRPGWNTNTALLTLVSGLRDTAALQLRKGHDFAAMEHLVLAWGAAQDYARLGDRDHQDTLWQAEQRGALLARTLLSSHALTARELETVARRLDRLAEARPAIFRSLAVDDALERALISDRGFATALGDAESFLPKTPGWRDLWSTPLRDARRLTTIARVSKAFLALESLPPWEREDAARRKLESIDPRACHPWELPEPARFRSDAESLTHMTLVRLAVALAWYESEHDSFPLDLNALVPRYLPLVPRCPLTGGPLHLDHGRVWFAAPPGDPTSTWEITPKRR